MDNLPNHINIDLEEKDIKRDLKDILNNMRKIRQEALKDNKFIPEVREEYLHLASRLGSIVNENEEQWVLDKIHSFSNGEFNLEEFDTLQTANIQKNPKSFNTLQHASLLMLGDNYCNLDDSYHALQVIKYLNSGNGNLENHKENCLFVKPFQEPKLEKRKKGMKGLAQRLFGYKYPISKKEGLEIALKTLVPLPKNLLFYIKGLGYIRASGVLPTESFKNISLEEGNKEIQDQEENSEELRAEFTLRDLEKRVSIDYFEVFSQHANIELPSNVEKNLAYKVGRPSLFGKGAKEGIGIEEFDYKVLSKILISELEEIVSHKDFLPKVNGGTKKDFDLFVEELKERFSKLKEGESTLDLFSFYKEGDNIKVIDNLGNRNNNSNDEFYFGGSINRVPLGKVAKIISTEKNDYNQNDYGENRVYIKNPDDVSSSFKLSNKEVSPTPGTKKRIFNEFVEKVKEKYTQKKENPKVDFIVDKDKEFLYYKTMQKIGDYKKGTYMFLGPNKRTVLCGFEKNGELEEGKNLFKDIEGLGKKLISGDNNPEKVIGEYFSSQEHMPYLHLVQYENGEKINDLEVRK